MYCGTMQTRKLLQLASSKSCRRSILFQRADLLVLDSAIENRVLRGLQAEKSAAGSAWALVAIPRHAIRLAPATTAGTSPRTAAVHQYPLSHCCFRCDRQFSIVVVPGRDSETLRTFRAYECLEGGPRFDFQRGCLGVMAATMQTLRGTGTSVPTCASQGQHRCECRTRNGQDRPGTAGRKTDIGEARVSNHSIGTR